LVTPKNMMAGPTAGVGVTVGVPVSVGVPAAAVWDGVTSPGQPRCALLTAVMSSGMVTASSRFASKDVHRANGSRPSAMPTPVTSSLTRT
jgi:hypothetical protein